MGERMAGGELWITRMKQDGTDYDVVRMAYADNGAAEHLDHARRVFKSASQVPDDLRRGDLLVTLLEANGDLSRVNPLRVPADQADWFLEEWLNVPKEWREDRRYLARRTSTDSTLLNTAPTEETP